MNLQQDISSIYEEAKVGKEYVDECTRLILEWVNDSQFQSSAIKALIIMLSLLLPKCCRNSKAKDHTESLRRRLKLWKKGDLEKYVSFNRN